MDRVRFEATRVEDTSRDQQTELWMYGGGVGLRSSSAQIRRSRWQATSVTSGRREAWGGGLGLRFRSSVTMYESTFSDCGAGSKSHWAAGGSIGARPDTNVSLFGIELNTSTTSSSPGSSTAASSPQMAARALWVPPAAGAFDAAIIAIHQPACVSNDAATIPLIGFSQPVRRGAQDHKLLLRSLSVTAPGCEVIAQDVHVRECSGIGLVCGSQNTRCTMKSNETVATPTCSCKLTDPEQRAFVPFVPSPDGSSKELAPYTHGCIEPRWLNSPEHHGEGASGCHRRRARYRARHRN